MTRDIKPTTRVLSLDVMTIESLLRVDGGTSPYLPRWKHTVERFATGVLLLASLLSTQQIPRQTLRNPPKKEGLTNTIRPAK